MKHTISAKKIKALRRKLLLWYQANGRHDLPWRKNPTPYRVLVSEIMLQQTQVNRVIPKYRAWLQHFPTLKTLADARPDEVLKIWSGLGYNRRALMLQNCARAIIEKHNGQVPEKYSELVALPGIGSYTANAINIFARNKDGVCIDTNVRRVLIHEFTLSPRITARELSIVATRVAPLHKAREWHSALMDYGAAVATSAKTKITPRGSKQTPFQGSKRQIRGGIIRYLVDQGVATSATLARALKTTKPRVQTIAATLEQEGMIQRRGARLQLAK